MAGVIQLPSSDKLKDMATDFERGWGLPQCVGAIDGSHIPRGVAHQILQIAKAGTPSFYKLWWMEGNVFGVAGSLHDARVLHVSGLWGH